MKYAVAHQLRDELLRTKLVREIALRFPNGFLYPAAERAEPQGPYLGKKEEAARVFTSTATRYRDAILSEL
jgi:hypothetical protein